MENNQPDNAQDVPSLDQVLGGEQQTQGTVFDALGDLDPGTPAGTEQPKVEGSTTGDEPKAPATNTPPNEANNTSEIANQDDLIKLMSADESLLSADDREFKAAVYDKFQAVGVDFKGNLLNANGQVVLTADDFDNYIDTGAVPLDENGNQVNALGEIVTNAADLTDSLNTIDLTKVFVEEDLGYKLVDEDGKPKSYPNTLEGNQQFAKDLAVAAQTSAVMAFLEAKPELKNVFYHLENGGTLEDYANTKLDYSNVDVNTLSKEEKLAYIKTSYEKQGVQNVSSIMDLLEAVGEDKLNQSTSDAILTLKEQAIKEERLNEERYRLQQIEDQKELNKYWNEVKGVIDNGNLKSFQISNAEKDDFYKYIAEPINGKGETREMLAAQKESKEDQLLISYLRYKGGDISQFIKSKSNLNRVEALRERLGKHVPIPSVNANKERSGASRGAAYVPDIGDILG